MVISSDLIELYEAFGKSDEAEKWGAELPQTEAVEEWHVTTYMVAIPLLEERDIFLKDRDTKMTPQTLTLPTFGGDPHPFFAEKQIFYGNL